MKTTPAFTFGMAALLLGSSLASASPFQPGEILLTGFSSGQRYSSAGVLLQSFPGDALFPGNGVTWEGIALTPTGNPTFGITLGPPASVSRVNTFSPEGVLINTFVGSGSFAFAQDLGVFANGTVAVIDDSTTSVTLHTQSGGFLAATPLPGIIFPMGGTIGTDNILYVVGRISNSLFKVSQTGVVLGSVSLGFSPGDLVMSPVDGTLWVSGFNNNLVEHITTAGTVLGSFPIGLSGGFSGIGMAPDGASLYVGTGGSGLVRHFDLSGNQLDQFNTGNSGISHMVVVPGTVPEPSTWASLAFGATALLARRRRA